MKKCYASNKNRYATKQEAEKIILLQGIDLHIYRCDNCHGWHLTKSTHRHTR